MEKELIIGDLPPEEILETLHCVVSEVSYAVRNNYTMVPLDKNMEPISEKASDIYENKELVNFVKKRYLDKPKRMMRIELEMKESIRRSLMEEFGR